MGDSGQGCRSTALQVKIDGHYILARMMTQDITGGGNHRIALRQGRHNIRLKIDPVNAHPGHQG